MIINRALQCAHRALLQSHIRRYLSLSSVQDPYFILGVDKNADFAEIKKAFYKLANEYHPDKTSDEKDSQKKFLLAKEAYQAIKLQKGITKPKGFVYDHDVSSMRPDPSRFDTDDEEYMHKNADYRMYQEKAESSQKYEQFRGTFKTVGQINEIKIRVEKGQLKDPTSRFKLQELRMNIRRISGSGIAFYSMITLGVLFFGTILSQYINESLIEEKTKGMSLREEKNRKRSDFQSQESKQVKFVKQMEKREDIKEYLEQEKKRQPGSLKKTKADFVKGEGEYA